MLTYADKFLRTASISGLSKILPRAAEASWVLGDWSLLRRHLSKMPDSIYGNFEVGISRALIALADKEQNTFKEIISILRRDISVSLTPSSTASIQACHDPLLKLHILYELEALSEHGGFAANNRENTTIVLDKRLNTLGAYLSEKEYLLSIRRAVLQLSGFVSYKHL